jgi:transcriptional regulator GlxA family with amidase domain
MAEDRNPLRVGIVLFQGVELLDFAGPAEVFTVADYQVCSLAEDTRAVLSMNRFRLLPDSRMAEVPSLDILVIPGGDTRPLLKAESFLCKLRALALKTPYLLSVCTGARLLAALGLLNNKEATTFHENLAELAELAPAARIRINARYTDNGKILTTGGVTAGIDGALHLVHKLSGADRAHRVARYLEYPPHAPGNWVPLSSLAD